jgi:hypothetical protein
MGTGFLLEAKPLRRDVEHSPPAIAEVKNKWTCTSIAPINQTFMVFTGTNSPLYVFIILIASTIQLILWR